MHYIDDQVGGDINYNTDDQITITKAHATARKLATAGRGYDVKALKRPKTTSDTERKRMRPVDYA